jgi:hypothetical protein
VMSSVVTTGAMLTLIWWTRASFSRFRVTLYGLPADAEAVNVAFDALRGEMFARLSRTTGEALIPLALAESSPIGTS